MPDEAPTIATVLKSKGYATGQFGKNHLGDLNQFPGWWSGLVAPSSDICSDRGEGLDPDPLQLLSLSHA